MPQLTEKIIKPERVVLKDGRKGYFINVPSGAVVVVKYPPAPVKKRTAAKILTARKTKQAHATSSIAAALKEVKSRKSKGNYPGKDFDSLMDEL